MQLIKNTPSLKIRLTLMATALALLSAPVLARANSPFQKNQSVVLDATTLKPTSGRTVMLRKHGSAEFTLNRQGTAVKRDLPILAVEMDSSLKPVPGSQVVIVPALENEQFVPPLSEITVTQLEPDHQPRIRQMNERLEKYVSQKNGLRSAPLTADDYESESQRIVGLMREEIDDALKGLRASVEQSVIRDLELYRDSLRSTKPQDTFNASLVIQQNSDGIIQIQRGTESPEVLTRIDLIVAQGPAILGEIRTGFAYSFGRFEKDHRYVLKEKGATENTYEIRSKTTDNWDLGFSANLQFLLDEHQPISHILAEALTLGLFDARYNKAGFLVGINTGTSGDLATGIHLAFSFYFDRDRRTALSYGLAFHKYPRFLSDSIVTRPENEEAPVVSDDDKESEYRHSFFVAITYKIGS